MERKVPVEVYSRVVGYYRPVNQWNKGKQAEFSERAEFDSIKIIEQAKKYPVKEREFEIKIIDPKPYNDFSNYFKIFEDPKGV